MGVAEARTSDLDQLQDLIARLDATAKALVADGQGGKVSTDDIAEILQIAARLFSAHTDKHGKTEWPVRKDALNATETVVLVTALLEAADINLFDLAIWYRRP